MIVFFSFCKDIYKFLKNGKLFSGFEFQRIVNAELLTGSLHLMNSYRSNFVSAVKSFYMEF